MRLSLYKVEANAQISRTDTTGTPVYAYTVPMTADFTTCLVTNK